MPKSNFTKKTLLFALFSISLVSFTIYNNEKIFNLIINKLEEYDTKHFPEKIYLHTDKPYYSLDESIWFTAYLVNGIDHLKSSKSMVMHVDLINSRDSIVASRELYIPKTTSAGDFKISKNWKPGKYLLRAYTNEMRNGNSNDFFQKEITVMAAVQKDSSIVSTKANSSEEITSDKENYKIPRPDINFYPESGYLVNGIINKVAIKVKDPIFKNQTIKGIIIDNDNTEIFSFKTIHLGLGLIVFKPEENKTYTAIVDINGSEERYELPKALSKGYIINAINNGKKLSVTISSNQPNGLQGTFLVGHQRGKHLYNKLETSNKTSYSLNFPTQKLKDGILHLTLFNSEGNPVAERLLYIENPENNISINVSTSDKNIKTREKITLSIDTKDVTGSITPSTLSMSVRDLAAVPQNNFVENIKTYLLLNSDLRGAIENPGYFFETPNDPKRRYLLDLTMMTNGWRRFTWQSLLHETPKIKRFETEKGLFIKGKTKALKKPYDNRSTATRLTFVGNTPQQELQQSDSLGKFTYGPFVFYDSIPTLIEARLYSFKSEKYKNRNVVILMDNKKPDKPKVNRPKSIESTSKDQSQLDAYLKISKYIKQINLEYEQQMQLLDEVIVVGHKKDENEIRNEEFDARTRHGYTDKRIVTEDIIGGDSYSVFDLLRSVGGVNVIGNSVSIRGGGTPKFLLDDMEIDDTLLESLSGIDIDFIDVLTGADAAVYSNSGNGVIALYSKIGGSALSKNIRRKPGIIDFQAQGFYTARKFYAPDHLNGFEEMSKADIRTTLHWEPTIKISKNKSSEISFFSCDTKGDYIIDIQGITDTGTPIQSISTITVH